jgi:hypothetical protein
VDVEKLDAMPTLRPAIFKRSRSVEYAHGDASLFKRRKRALPGDVRMSIK